LFQVEAVPEVSLDLMALEELEEPVGQLLDPVYLVHQVLMGYLRQHLGMEDKVVSVMVDLEEMEETVLVVVP
jgi:hypothetical protein